MLVDQVGISPTEVARVLEAPPQTVVALRQRAAARLPVGQSLPKLDPAEHGADFWPNLGARLIAEREVTGMLELLADIEKCPLPAPINVPDIN